MAIVVIFIFHPICKMTQLESNLSFDDSFSTLIIFFSFEHQWKRDKCQVLQQLMFVLLRIQTVILFIVDMDLNDHNNINYTSFQNTRSSHHNRSSSQTTTQAQSIDQQQQGKWTIAEQHLVDFIALEQERHMFGLSDRRRQMHPSSRHVCNFFN